MCRSCCGKTRAALRWATTSQMESPRTHPAGYSSRQLWPKATVLSAVSWQGRKRIPIRNTFKLRWKTKQEISLTSCDCHPLPAIGTVPDNWQLFSAMHLCCCWTPCCVHFDKTPRLLCRTTSRLALHSLSAARLHQVRPSTKCIPLVIRKHRGGKERL